MRSFFYTRLVFTNMKKNSKFYIPYLLTCIGCIMTYFIMDSLYKDPGILQVRGGGNMKAIIYLGTIIISIFSAIFLMYTNSFLIKRRKKELGLYNILGMEKRHISRILFLETLYTALIGLSAGILAGILFSKLMRLLLFRLLHLAVPIDIGLNLSSVLAVCKWFGIIFLLILAYNLSQLHMNNPIELLKGGQTGEREPKTKRLMTLVGLLCLGSGYYISLVTENASLAITVFFVAVILVIIGTYCLFTAGSIALLKAMKKQKRYYYQTKHFISVSSMIYRMKQNAAGLASICILSTMVLVMLSSTITLYAGLEDQLKTLYPKNFNISAYSVTDDAVNMTNDVVSGALTDSNYEISGYTTYRYFTCTLLKQGDQFLGEMPDLASYNDIKDIYFIPLEDYNALAGSQDTLADNEVILYTTQQSYHKDEISLLGHDFRIKEVLSQFDQRFQSRDEMIECYYVVVPDITVLESLLASQEDVFLNIPSSGKTYVGFNVEADDKTQDEIAATLSAALSQMPFKYGIDYLADGRKDYFVLNGGLFFLGIFLGSIFIMATVLIIYYKQISEGYDDKERFEIMQKVGLESKQIKSSIRSQLLLMFFLPLATAALHVAFAFPIITRLLAALQLTNVPLFAWCTVGTILVFGVMYGIVYGLTSRVYYKIVS